MHTLAIGRIGCTHKSTWFYKRGYQIHAKNTGVRGRMQKHLPKMRMETTPEPPKNTIRTVATEDFESVKTRVFFTSRKREKPLFLCA